MKLSQAAQVLDGHAILPAGGYKSSIGAKQGPDSVEPGQQRSSGITVTAAVRIVASHATASSTVTCGAQSPLPAAVGLCGAGAGWWIAGEGPTGAVEYVPRAPKAVRTELVLILSPEAWMENN
ncbi:hypothetical protein TgHK011_002842 [Trichoderma gracile]|nr:hypothetical protein TgHK011_002842 [Trichoderma gracile]